MQAEISDHSVCINYIKDYSFFPLFPHFVTFKAKWAKLSLSGGDLYKKAKFSHAHAARRSHRFLYIKNTSFDCYQSTRTISISLEKALELSSSSGSISGSGSRVSLSPGIR